MYRSKKLFLIGLYLWMICPIGIQAAQQGQLPAGAELSVGIDAVDTSLGSGNISVSGNVAIGPPVDPAATQIIYVVDLSGSTLQSEPCGDQTTYSNALPDTLHQCIVAALIAANENAVSQGIGEVGLVLYASSAMAADLSPDPGFQGLTDPGTISDIVSLTPDVEKVIRSTAVDFSNGTVAEFTPGSVGHGTNYDAAVDEAVFLSRTGLATNRLVIFISDGFASVGNSVASTLAARTADGSVPKFNTVALGSDCSADPNGLGSLQMLAEATGGHCTNIPDFNTLTTLDFGFGPPTLTALAAEIDAGASVPFEAGEVQTLPLTGPQTAIFSKTLSNVPMGLHELCVVATGRDPGGSSSVRDCRQIGIGLPKVFLFSPSDGQVFTDPTIVFSGSANDLEDGDLTPNLLWTSDIDGILGNGGEVTATLSPGIHLITASVTDSDGLSDSKQITITVDTAVNTPPTVQITAPPNTSNIIEGQGVTFSGTAADAEDGDLTALIQWSSSLDGVLGTGGTLTDIILSIGTHQISANVSDSAGETATAAIEITVVANQAPTVSIISPTDGATFYADQPIDLQGVASDVEDGDLSANIQWDSDVDGSLGSGGSLTVMVSLGVHRITASVADSYGVASEATVSINVVNPPPSGCEGEKDDHDEDECNDGRDDDDDRDGRCKEDRGDEACDHDDGNHGDNHNNQCKHERKNDDCDKSGKQRRE
ncbi:MAG: hypothetical protein ACU84J_04710 [Gammaproteobacteria bacterium]